jgi:hypothetical protein
VTQTAAKADSERTAAHSKSVSGRARAWVDALRPYQCLLILAVPIGIVEPLKLVAVALLGAGHWIAGTSMIAGAYAVSLLLVERLLVLFKPKLLKLPWLAKVWAFSVVLKYRFLRRFTVWRRGELVPAVRYRSRAVVRDRQ